MRVESPSRKGSRLSTNSGVLQNIFSASDDVNTIFAFFLSWFWTLLNKQSQHYIWSWNESATRLSCFGRHWERPHEQGFLFKRTGCPFFYGSFNLSKKDKGTKMCLRIFSWDVEMCHLQNSAFKKTGSDGLLPADQTSNVFLVSGCLLSAPGVKS